MGGNIWVESELGQGSCFGFRIALPISEEAQPPLPSMPRDVRKALVVDDLAVNRAILEKQLSQLGIEVIACNSAADALEQMAEGVDMILSDHNMPDRDGLELAEDMRARGWSDVPFVLLSSNPSAAQSDPASRFLQGILQKPIPRAELFSRLCELGAELPAKSAVQTGRPSPQVSENSDRAQESRLMRVLAAEDNRTNQLVLRKMLKSLHIDLRFANNGVEAVDAHRDFAPDLIFMDISMPKMDGKEATGQIRRSEEGTGAHVPIVALTAHAMNGDADAILAAGLDHYMTKPLRKDLIHKHILDHCPADARLPSACAEPPPADQAS